MPMHSSLVVFFAPLLIGLSPLQACVGDDPTSARIDAPPDAGAAPQPDAGAATPIDAGGPTDAADGLSVAVAGLNRPTVLLQDGSRVYIAAADGVHMWADGDSMASLLYDTPGPARGMARVPGGPLFVHADDSLYLLERKNETTTAIKCAATLVQSFARLGSQILYGTSTGLRKTAAGPVCEHDNTPATDNPEGAPSPLYADATALYRYRETEFGSIVACTDPENCGDTTTVIRTAVGKVEALLADDDRVYWSTASAVFSSPKAGGSVTTLADEQPRPRAMAVSGGTLYWTTDGGTLMVAEVGKQGTARVVAGNLKRPSGLIVTANHVLVSETERGRIVRIPRVQ